MEIVRQVIGGKGTSYSGGTGGSPAMGHIDSGGNGVSGEEFGGARWKSLCFFL